MERISGYFGVCHHFRCGLLLEAVTPNFGLRGFACLVRVLSSPLLHFLMFSPFISIDFRFSSVSLSRSLCCSFAGLFIPYRSTAPRKRPSLLGRIDLSQSPEWQEYNLAQNSYKQRIDLFCETVFAVSDLFTGLQIAKCPLICRVCVCQFGLFLAISVAIGLTDRFVWLSQLPCYCWCGTI